MATSSIHNYSILFLIIMKDTGSKVFKLVKANSALDFLKNSTSLDNASEGIIFDKIHCIVFYLLDLHKSCCYEPKPNFSYKPNELKVLIRCVRTYLTRISVSSTTKATPISVASAKYIPTVFSKLIGEWPTDDNELSHWFSPNRQWICCHFLNKPASCIAKILKIDK